MHKSDYALPGTPTADTCWGATPALLQAIVWLHMLGGNTNMQLHFHL